MLFLYKLYTIFDCTCMQRKKQSKEKPKIPSNKAIDRKSNKEITEGPYFNKNNAEINLGKASNEELRAHLRELKKMLSEKQLEVMQADKIYRMESFKNQSFKNRVADTEKYCEKIRIGLTKRLISQCKQVSYKDQGNKDSPLFYNQNGLSPYELMLLNYSKNQDFSENICMTCFMDIQANTHIVRLPCTHLLHRECGMQHLLYSKNCPACSQEINIAQLRKN